ncbi:hypothetical protein F3Y22_tig00113725pilonHSYRG01879 [Hibiscus syriacus]|uniref:Reverse transcriptase zinc-binding domain-containing protein n=1 Tax=Hibiscus syriacus TaxID=106335 RepID=A0A6A2WPI8_HIBSY|nr:hypothetical protein F3Y22_tig00113725pilonHSYRG01879 [Hibiscus syriacus]
MGNDNKIEFWFDHWTEVVSLKDSFPRIFGISIQKSDKVREFGLWNFEVWEWKIELRRVLFDWELVLWNGFLQVSNRAISSTSDVDILKWIGVSDGLYKPKIYCSHVACVGMVEDPLWKMV